ncbi:MAG: glutamate racemase [Bacteroidetes bacterium]|nr:glutamate racemase [Bacteroidota bacterium]HQW45685.1 glutamate racemase [Chitinophagaceae bacterium]MBK7039286.1 glutamate racemase [Bacteroidota bacterium]MBK7588172.1 glutamate racemase [Bacteroidota bacterium]MBK8329074.1 glutamate racemase [Bacteroidota bacterium]
MVQSQPIGIFDSGIGGLTVARSLKEALPLEQFIYFGDTAHMPYGDKSPEEILQYSKKIVEFLIANHVKLIVIACNSASSIAASALRSAYWKQVEIMGVIRPVVNDIVKNNIKKIGIIGTQATIQSQIYPHLLHEADAQIEIYQLATPLLAPMIEAGKVSQSVLYQTMADYLSDKHFEDKEAILLACTHYPIIKDEVNTFFKHQKRIFDNAAPLAFEVKKYLTDKNLLATVKKGANQFYVSRYSDTFEKAIYTFYGKQLEVKEVHL